MTDNTAAMTALGVILAREGSKGLPKKCVRALLGRPVITYTFDHVRESRLLSAAVLTTDCAEAKTLATDAGLDVIDRPTELATDTATVDSAARHAVEQWERKHRARVDIVVLLYGNIPVRPGGIVDRAIEKLVSTGADSVRSVAAVTKQHPDWLHRLDGDRMAQLRSNSIYRRQDLEPLYYHDGAVAAVTRDALFGALETPDDHQAFLGRDRRALIYRADQSLDIDEPIDLHVADALLRNGSMGSTAENELPILKRPHVEIGGRLVGPGSPTLIVAEAGVNHNGSLATALTMVDAAADAGADAVKLQMFRAADLATSSAATAEYQRAGTRERSQLAMLCKLELSDEAFEKIRAHCDQRSIRFIVTPFCHTDVRRLVRLDPAAIKIASPDIADVLLLDAAAATGVPLILSTGAATLEEIAFAVERLRTAGAAKRTVLLRCTSCYPAPIHALNLRAIISLHERFQMPSGLSDHSLSTQMGALAVAAGACVLEKHFTLDRAAEGPDHAMSMAPDQLSEYVSAVRESESALGSGEISINELEAEVRTVARKSLVCATNIKAGAKITRDVLTLKRPGTGIPVRDIECVVDRCAIVDIPSDTTLTWEMIR